jgi:ATP-dependent DNA helicase RecG
MTWVDSATLLLAKSLSYVPQELNEIDWKEKLSANTERLVEHLCAFANYEGGGYLAFGITNEGASAPLSKPDMDLVIDKLSNIARNNLEIPILLEHAVIEFKGHAVLLIKVPESREKPSYIKGKNIYESFRRSAGHTVQLSKQEVRTLIAISSGHHFEEQIVHFEKTGDEVLTLLNYDSYFSLSGTRLPDSKLGILNALNDDDIIERKNNSWDITNLGAILFAKDLKLFKALKRKSIRVIVYRDTSRINAMKEQEGAKGYASGFEGLIEFIMNELPENEIIESALRKKAKVYPRLAVREFVANALIHQDFNVNGTGVLIEIFADRIEITNPGMPLVETNRFIDSAPKSRNEQLASLMRRLNICEERGSGVDRAIGAIEAHQLPAPKFISSEDYTRVIMYAPIPLTKMNGEDRVRACYQHTVLNYVSNQPVNNQSIRKRFNIGKNNTSTASKIIAEALEAGLIKSADPANASKKYASYVPYWA